MAAENGSCKAFQFSGDILCVLVAAGKHVWGDSSKKEWPLKYSKTVDTDS